MKKNLLHVFQLSLAVTIISACGIGKIKSTLNMSQPESNKESAPSNKDAQGEKAQDAQPANALSGSLVAAGGETTCITNKDGESFCWGKNNMGQTGRKFSKNEPLGPQSVITGASKAVSMALGKAFSCLLSDSNILKCWGDNSSLQLGIGDSAVTSNPVPTIVSPKYTNQVTQISSTESSVCFLLSNGNFECIGNNSDHRLAVRNTSTPNNLPVSGFLSLPNPTTTNPNNMWSIYYSSVPLQSTELAGIRMKQISDGRFGFGEDGKVYCWGNIPSFACQYESGRITGTLKTPSESPVKSFGRTGGVQYVLTENNEVWGWGNNSWGSLGNPEVSNSPAPLGRRSIGQWVRGVEFEKVQIKSFAESSFTALDAQCVITQDGGVRCLGRNYFGYLGNGNATPTDGFSDVLTEVIDETKSPIKNVKKVFGGSRNFCALKDDGSVWCWGQNVASGSTLGANRITDFPDQAAVPFAVKVIDSGAKDIWMGIYTGCALMENNSINCWGEIWRGILGNQFKTNQTRPVEIPELRNNVKAFQQSSANNFLCVITLQDRVACMGDERFGQLGVPWSATTMAEANALSVQKTFKYLPYYGGFDNSTKISAGDAHACILSGGAARCWGNNEKGQLGVNSVETSSEPLYVNNLFGKVVDVALGQSHSCFLEESGKVRCSGDNSKGQLAQANMDSSKLPLLVTIADNVVSLGSGKDHVCAITQNGQIFCWGNNNAGQVGDRSYVRRINPAQVNGFNGRATMVVGGESHTCALNDAGAVFCWGDNQYGQLGSGNSKSSLSPVAVVGLPGKITSLSSGSNHTCAVTADNSTYCWGMNTDNQLGNDNKESNNKPVLVQVKK